MTNLGFQILPAVRKVPDEILEEYKHFVTPHLSDNMNRLNAVNATIRPMHKKGKLYGHAFTVKTRPGDNLMVHKAIDLANAGDVIVVDGGGEMTHALIGEIMVRMAFKKGIHGFVIDGAIRDSESIGELNFPVYAKGVTHRGPYKDGPGEINIPIQVGGAVVYPGDIVVGDGDGIIIVPADHAFDLIDKIKATIERESRIMANIENGTIDRSWVVDILRSKGCDGI